MRLHRLQIEAFGPFAGSETVDFDALSSAGLFLLHGATGAGKTSVLDAICFALYGVVPGARARGARLRSDHAAPGTAPQVRLELTVAGRRLEVTRSPAWERPKKRGEGFTTEPARTIVRELVDGQWVGRTNRNDEAAQLLHAVTGMSSAQFTQVVMLPQGEFAEFLRADAETRRPILQRLFSTGRFSDLETWLADQRRALDRQVDEVDREVDGLLARAAEAAGLGREEPEESALLRDGQAGDGQAGDGQAGDGQAGDGQAGRAAVGQLVKVTAGPGTGQPGAAEWVAGLLSRAEDELTAAAAVARTATSASAAAAAELTRGRTVAERADRWLGAQARMQELDAAEAAHAKRADELARAVSAASLDVQAAALRVAETDQAERAERSRGAVEHAQRLAIRLGFDPSSLSADRAETAAPETVDLGASVADTSESAGERGRADAALRLLARRARQRCADLTELARDAAHRATLQAEVDRVAEQIAQTELQRSGLVDRLAELPALRQRLDQQRDAARATAASLPAATATVEQAERRLAAATELVEVAQRHREAELARADAVDAAQGRRAEWLDLRERRLAGMAAELAGLLEQAAPCPVCGSTDHPAPAHPAADSVRAEDERAAQARFQAAETARQQADAGLASLATREAELVARASDPDGEPVGPDQAERDLAEARKAHAASLAAQHDVAALQERLATLEQDLATSRTELLACETALAQLRERAERFTAQAQQITAAVEAALGPGVDPAEQAAQLEDLADAADTAAETMTDADSGLAQVRVLRDSLAVAAAHAGFVDLESALAARRSPEQAAALERAMREHQEARAAASAVLADPELRAAAEHPTPDLPGLTETAATLAEHARLAGLAEHTARARVEALHRIADELGQTLTKNEPLRARAASVRELSRLAEGTGGGNTRRMRLSSFVLAARLEAVAAAATTRLLAMSAGRYALVHTDEADGRGRSGLGLRVVDSWTGAERDTTSLSGGESFYASLALALGLADVVAAEAGGALVDTLFVDEGFGSLDEDSLDEVLDTLDALRDGGRAVGVVSHVADMRARIPAQLRVRKGRNGSRLQVVGTS